MAEDHLKDLRKQIQTVSRDNVIFEIIYDKSEGLEFQSFPAFCDFVYENDFDEACAEWFYPESDEYSSVTFRFDKSDVHGTTPEYLKFWILQNLEDALVNKIYNQKYTSG
jgi:hypothetical protein